MIVLDAHGLSANLAWALIFAIAPVSGVYYPIAVLPEWLQAVAAALPSSHVFEGMRAVLIERVFEWNLFWYALALNAAYLEVGVAIFLRTFHSARRHGWLLHAGE